jgi:ketosteroid isomerase-like protein
MRDDSEAGQRDPLGRPLYRQRAFTKGASMDQPDATNVLTAFVNDYTAAWNSGDVAAIVDAYATPCFVVKGGRVLRHNDQEAKRRYFEELVSNQVHGPHVWSIGNLDMHPLGRDAAMITVRWIARRPDQYCSGTFSIPIWWPSRTVVAESWATLST